MTLAEAAVEELSPGVVKRDSISDQKPQAHQVRETKEQWNDVATTGQKAQCYIFPAACGLKISPTDPFKGYYGKVWRASDIHGTGLSVQQVVPVPCPLILTVTTYLLTILPYSPFSQ